MRWLRFKPDFAYIISEKDCVGTSVLLVSRPYSYGSSGSDNHKVMLVLEVVVVILVLPVLEVVIVLLVIYVLPFLEVVV